jgi:hypothetical protein
VLQGILSTPDGEKELEVVCTFLTLRSDVREDMFRSIETTQNALARLAQWDFLHRFPGASGLRLDDGTEIAVQTLVLTPWLKMEGTEKTIDVLKDGQRVRYPLPAAKKGRVWGAIVSGLTVLLMVAAGSGHMSTSLTGATLAGPLQIASFDTQSWMIFGSSLLRDGLPTILLFLFGTLIKTLSVKSLRLIAPLQTAVRKNIYTAA